MPITRHGWTFTVYSTVDMKEGVIRTGHKNAQPIHPYRATKPGCWNSEIFIKCRKLVGSTVRASTHPSFAVELFKGAAWCSQSVELSQADGSDWVWTSCSAGASGFCLAFHIPKLAVLPIPSPASHAAFIHHFLHLLPLPSPQLWFQ